MANAVQNFGNKWVDEKVLNFLQFLQIPLRSAAEACDCPHMDECANKLELVRGMFVVADYDQRDRMKKDLFGWAYFAQATMCEPDTRKEAPQLSPEKLQMGGQPLLMPVQAEKLQGFTKALVHILENMDYGKLARYLTMFGEQQFEMWNHTELPTDVKEAALAQLRDNGDGADEQEQSAPSSISSDE